MEFKYYPLVKGIHVFMKFHSFVPMFSFGIAYDPCILDIKILVSEQGVYMNVISIQIYSIGVSIGYQY